jgi:hypothetical protein
MTATLDLPPTNTIPRPSSRASVATISDPGHSFVASQETTAGAELAFACASLSDIESARIAMANRVGAMAREEGASAVAGTPEVKRAHLILTALEDVEKLAIREVERLMRRHPLGPWVKATRGVGEKQGARLIAAIDDPLWNFAEDRPRRGPAELWQYGGHGDPARSRLRKGHKVEWNPEVKTRVYLCSKSVEKQPAGSCQLRLVYDDGRAKYADAIHTEPCARCGPKGDPAPAGSPLSLGHQQARALRLVGKALLLSLWDAARALDSNKKEPHRPTHR